MKIFHGSDHIIERPALGVGRKNNDYGQGFYCTEQLEMAKEWACKNGTDGFVNAYELDLNGLKVLHLGADGNTILNWIAVLLEHRTFNLDGEVAASARDYLIMHFGIDVDRYDVVIGYRADDSYFAFAEAFVSNALSLRSLGRAMHLGKLGEQVVLVSEKAFSRLQFLEAVPIEKELYAAKFLVRDQEARRQYKEEVASAAVLKDDLFVLDIIRQEMKNDDPRLQ